MSTLVGPLLLEFGHEDGEVGGVEGDGRVVAQHVACDHCVQEFGVFDEPHDGVEEVGGEGDGGVC